MPRKDVVIDDGYVGLFEFPRGRLALRDKNSLRRSEPHLKLARPVHLQCRGRNHQDAARPYAVRNADRLRRLTETRLVSDQHTAAPAFQLLDGERDAGALVRPEVSTRRAGNRDLGSNCSTQVHRSLAEAPSRTSAPRRKTTLSLQPSVPRPSPFSRFDYVLHSVDRIDQNSLAFNFHLAAGRRCEFHSESRRSRLAGAESNIGAAVTA